MDDQRLIAFRHSSPSAAFRRSSGFLDAHTNVQRTVDHISSWLGKAPIGQRWNTLVATWKCGLAEISLTAFPPEWQSGNTPNDAHDQEPRLRTTCMVNVATCFILPLSEQEIEWVSELRQIPVDGMVGSAQRTRAGDHVADLQVANRALTRFHLRGMAR